MGINNNGRTAYVNRTTSEAAASKPVFETIATSACDANIIVQNNGQIQLGAGWGNAGVLRIEKGSTVTFQNGSTLEVNNASQIVVESGGKLILETGANINLLGAAAQIIVKSGGQLDVIEQLMFIPEPNNTVVSPSHFLIMSIKYVKKPMFGCTVVIGTDKYQPPTRGITFGISER